MSKPISFGFGKPKAPNGAKSLPAISLGTKRPAPGAARKPALLGDDDDNDDDQPKHEAVAGFSSTGAILTKPVEEKKARVIETQGNQDWRTRGRKNLLPSEVQAARNGEDVVMVEKDVVSTASGLQFAEASSNGEKTAAQSELLDSNGTQLEQPTKQLTIEEKAMQALLGDDDDRKPKSTVVIEQAADNQQRPANETDDFRADVASRPEASTLEDYNAMPVEEFGMAMLRGMGKKRRANGEVIQLESEKEKEPKKQRKQDGFLGIGAKAAPGLEEVELGAWGKADMRKNNKGAGFFTPLMMKNAKTGEVISEEELERRKKAGDAKNGGEKDWRERRDRNLERDGRERSRDDESDYRNGSSKRSRDDKDHGSSRSRRDRDESDYDSSRSRRHRSRSRDKSHRDDHRDRDGRRRDDDDKYESSSSRRDRDKDKDRDRDRDRDRHRHRDRDYDDDRRRRH